MTVAMEETEPVPSEDGWILTVHVNKVDSSPGGTRNVLQSESYNYRRGADSESAEEKKKRLEVKRKSRRRALDKFDEVRREASKAKLCKGKPTWFILDEHHGAQLHSLDIRLRFHTAF